VADLTKPSPEIAAIVRDAYPKLRRFFAKKVGPADVQDLAQATIVTFLEKDSARIDDPARFLFGIARNKLLQHFDRLRPGQPFDSQVISARQLSTTLGTKLHRSTQIIEGMRTLPLEWQIALELRYGEDLKLTEVAETMEMSLAQVKRYIKDGLAQMREKMREQLRSELDDDTLGERLGREYRDG
jgi:RNA polymerase sigma factor (sigma-70 family)